MTTRYRVEYALKTHRRDQLIEWIKGLLAVPFVLHSQPTAAYEGRDAALTSMAANAHRRYAEIFRDVEDIINDHIAHVRAGAGPSKLRHLVPSVGVFFTPLALEKAFIYQDRHRRISSRRFVAPSFNDIRLILNSAQCISLVERGPLKLVTFDGDVTLYGDGQSLLEDNPVTERILRLLANGIRIGIVTAAGYTEPARYAERLWGLLAAIQRCEKVGKLVKPQLAISGGECNYLLVYSASSSSLLELVPRSEWLLPEMRKWTAEQITALLDEAEAALRGCTTSMGLSASVIRKDRAVGIVPQPGLRRFTREQLEETVLVTQQVLEASPAGRQVPFCAFNGGNDVFVDIGDKSYGVAALQSHFGGIAPHETLHVGDQFLSAGANDFKARSACTTAWIASPLETVELLDELIEIAGERWSR